MSNSIIDSREDLDGYNYTTIREETFGGIPKDLPSEAERLRDYEDQAQKLHDEMRALEDPIDLYTPVRITTDGTFGQISVAGKELGGIVSRVGFEHGSGEVPTVTLTLGVCNFGYDGKAQVLWADRDDNQITYIEFADGATFGTPRSAVHEDLSGNGRDLVTVGFVDLQKEGISREEFFGAGNFNDEIGFGPKE